MALLWLFMQAPKPTGVVLPEVKSASPLGTWGAAFDHLSCPVVAVNNLNLQRIVNVILFPPTHASLFDQLAIYILLTHSSL